MILPQTDNLTAWSHTLESALSEEHIFNAILAVLILIIGLFVARKASEGLTRLPNLETQQKIALRKISYYMMAAFVFATALSQMGFNLKVLLGAAGVLTVGLGFAAQTSASNLISGLFLMVDRPFHIGDIVKVGDITGEVLAIDVLSSKIRTLDNVMVRIPNETMVKSNISNYSRFPIRRIDLKFGVSYAASMEAVEKALIEVATTNPLCLDEPAPLFIFSGFGPSAQELQFSVWTLSSNLRLAQNQLLNQIKARFDQEKIEIPFITPS
jgi:small-conductance mechanosensitive channel